MKWRKLSDNEEVILSDYLKEWIEKNPMYKIYIGCDSQNVSGRTKFATVIVLHNVGRGGHVLYNKQEFDMIKSNHEKLWREVEFSVEAAKIVMEFNIQPSYIDIDLNPDHNYQSNDLLRSAVGLINSLGLEARPKRMDPWSISIADKLVKPKRKNKRKPRKLKQKTIYKV